MYGWIRKAAEVARDFAHGIDTANAIRHGVPISERAPSRRPAKCLQETKPHESTRLSPEPSNALADAERARARLNSHLLAQIEEIAGRRARVG